MLIKPKTDNTAAQKTLINYAISIMHNTGYLEMAKREYYLYGGLGVDVNHDGQIVDIVEDNPNTPWDDRVTETTVEWCFKYGEDGWKRGLDFSDVQTSASSYDDEGNDKEAVGQIICTTGEVLN
jgi:hypothetical protein